MKFSIRLEAACKSDKRLLNAHVDDTHPERDKAGAAPALAQQALLASHRIKGVASTWVAKDRVDRDDKNCYLALFGTNPFFT